MRKRIAVIPARSGSKRLPYKNEKKIGIDSLVGWAVRIAKEAQFDRIIISSDYITSCPSGCEIHRREPEDATDSAAFPPIIPKIVHQEEALICLLQPTSPLRRAEDIYRGFDLWQEGHSVISVVKINPYTLMLNGAVYIADIELLREHGDFVNPIYYPMPKARSIDIDTREDYEIAKSIFTYHVANGILGDDMEWETE